MLTIVESVSLHRLEVLTVGEHYNAPWRYVSVQTEVVVPMDKVGQSEHEDRSMILIATETNEMQCTSGMFQPFTQTI